MESILDYERRANQEEKVLEDMKVASKYCTKTFGTSLEEDGMTFHAKKARCRHFLKTAKGQGLGNR